MVGCSQRVSAPLTSSDELGLISLKGSPQPVRIMPEADSHARGNVVCNHNAAFPFLDNREVPGAISDPWLIGRRLLPKAIAKESAHEDSVVDASIALL